MKNTAQKIKKNNYFYLENSNEFISRIDFFIVYKTNYVICIHSKKCVCVCVWCGTKYILYDGFIYFDGRNRTVCIIVRTNVAVNSIDSTTSNEHTYSRVVGRWGAGEGAIEKKNTTQE